ncbi:hypothetical protein D3Z45_07060 [Lachnospiraceae bacterium]|nr:hypothetical protein [Lachnospiraceae bacterium]
MNNCLVLLLLLCCCGNNNNRGCDRDRDIPDNCGCGGRDARNDGRCRDRDRDRDREDSCRGGFGPFPSPGSTCGCEEKKS